MKWKISQEKMVVILILASLIPILSLYNVPKKKKKNSKQQVQQASKKNSSFEERVRIASKKNPRFTIFMIFFNVLGPLLLALFFWIFFFFKWTDGEKFFPPKAKISPNWGILDVFFVLIFFFFCQIYIPLFFSYLPLDALSSKGKGLLAGNLLMMLVPLFIFFSAKTWWNCSYIDIGFHFKKAVIEKTDDLSSSAEELLPKENIAVVKKALVRGMMGYFMIFPLILGSVFVAQKLGEAWNIPTVAHPIVNFFDQGNMGEIFYLVFVACILAPFAEETFFRGFAYPVVRKSLGKWPAMILISAFFASLHPGFHSFFPIFILGMLLVYLYEKTGSLWPSILVHSLNNTLTFAKLFLLKSFLG